MISVRILWGWALVSSVALFGVIGSTSTGPLFAPKPAYANIAIVPTANRLSRASTRHSSVSHFSRSSDGLFYVHAKVNGVSIRFVLDTGATVVVLTPTDARRIGLAHQSSGQRDRMETAGGLSAIKRITLDRITVAGHNIRDVDAALVGDGLETSLLGQNLLSQLGPITLTQDEAELR